MITDPKPMHEAVPLHASEALRGHRHTHGHDHGQDHHYHHDTAQRPALPRRSLLALSGGMRLLLVLPLIALLWALTFWAVNDG